MCPEAVMCQEEKQVLCPEIMEGRASWASREATGQPGKSRCQKCAPRNQCDYAAWGLCYSACFKVMDPVVWRAVNVKSDEDRGRYFNLSCFSAWTSVLIRWVHLSQYPESWLCSHHNHCAVTSLDMRVWQDTCRSLYFVSGRKTYDCPKGKWICVGHSVCVRHWPLSSFYLCCHIWSFQKCFRLMTFVSVLWMWTGEPKEVLLI